MNSLPPLKTDDLVSQAIAALRQFVLEELVEPGSELPSQGELCQRLGVSRTVIREAMRSLESQGLIEISQGKRPRVLPASSRTVIDSLSTLMERSSVSLLDVLEVRKPLEIQAAILAAEKATPEQIEQMRAANDALEQAQTIEEQILADMRFHRLIADASGNPVFGIMLDVLTEFLFESRRTTLTQSGASVALHYHRQLLDAMESGDIARTQAAAMAGLLQTESDLRLEALSSE